MGVRDGIDVPGGAGSGLSHIAAPGTAERKWTEAQRKQSARDKDNHASGMLDALCWQEPAAPGLDPSKGKGKGKGKVKGPNKDKVPAPTGTCCQFWEHGKCDRLDASQPCKWEHVRANHPSAPAYIKAGKVADKARTGPKAKAKGKGKGKTAKGIGKGTQEQ